VNFSALDKWFVEINKEGKEFSSIAQVLEILKSVEKLNICKIWVGKDGGPRPWWYRLLAHKNGLLIACSLLNGTIKLQI
jgi:hypothetical protein